MIWYVNLLSQYRRSSRQCNHQYVCIKFIKLCLNTAEAVDNVIKAWIQFEKLLSTGLNTAEAVDNVITYVEHNWSEKEKSQYRRSSRQCNQYEKKSLRVKLRLNTAEAVDNVITKNEGNNSIEHNGLNTAEAVDNVITMITNDLQKNSIIGLCRKGLSLNKDYIFFP